MPVVVRGSGDIGDRTVSCLTRELRYQAPGRVCSQRTHPTEHGPFSHQVQEGDLALYDARWHRGHHVRQSRTPRLAPVIRIGIRFRFRFRIRSLLPPAKTFTWSDSSPPSGIVDVPVRPRRLQGLNDEPFLGWPPFSRCALPDRMASPARRRRWSGSCS